jgi:PLP dependent protein
MQSNEVKQRIDELKQSVASMASKNQQRPEDIKILLVSKTVPAEKILQAVDAGVMDFGENKVQELLSKKKEIENLAPSTSIRWHMIGHLQTNKVKQVVREVSMIQSIDRIELMDEIERQAERQQIPSVDCLIQVNTSGEASKSGFSPENVRSGVLWLRGAKHIRVRGLMTIGPFTDDSKKVRAAFHLLKEIQQQLKKNFPEKDWNTLSMGMSGDYPIAIEEGANLIRIGTAVFGERKPSKQ